MAEAKTLLVVEDERVVALDIQKSLVDLGYRVPATAATADQALKLAAEHRPDLVLMDIRIKGPRDGIETAAILRERFGIPVVFLTAYADAPTVERAKITEPYAYLLKPIKANELRSTIEIALYKHQNEQRFRAMFESAPTAMVMIDADGAIVLVNAQTEKVFGYGREQLLGQPIEMLIPQRFRAAHPGMRSGFFAGPKARQMGSGRELYGLRKDDTEFPVEISLSLVQTEAGLMVLSAIVDISERKRQADALERNNIELQRFAYVASHDLQTPMRSIASFVGLLRSTYADKLDAQANDWIRRTAESIKHLQTLVRDLLEYSHVDSQAHPFRPVQVRKIFDSAVSLLDASIQESRAEISCGELPVVMGDQSQLVQLMLNLIGNGLKYRGADPPRVHVSAERKGTEWTFAVRDNGIGIAPKHHERIFEIFKRLHDQQEYPGTGIGLAVCRRVVHRHGGKIWVESAPDKGSVFFFTIASKTENAQ